LGKIVFKTILHQIRDRAARITAYDSSDPDAGDIRNAIVKFYKDGNLLGTASVGLVNPSDTKTGTAAIILDVDIGSADSVSFTISIVVNGYYTAATAKSSLFPSR